MQTVIILQNVVLCRILSIPDFTVVEIRYLERAIRSHPAQLDLGRKSQIGQSAGQCDQVAESFLLNRIQLINGLPMDFSGHFHLGHAYRHEYLISALQEDILTSVRLEEKIVQVYVRKQAIAAKYLNVAQRASLRETLRFDYCIQNRIQGAQGIIARRIHLADDAYADAL